MFFIDSFTLMLHGLETDVAHRRTFRGSLPNSGFEDCAVRGKLVARQASRIPSPGHLTATTSNVTRESAEVFEVRLQKQRASLGQVGRRWFGLSVSLPVSGNCAGGTVEFGVANPAAARVSYRVTTNVSSIEEQGLDGTPTTQQHKL
jgi:hypothetical protein